MSTKSESEQVSPAGLSSGGGDSGSESFAFSDPEVAAMTAAQLQEATAANQSTEVIQILARQRGASAAR